MSKPLLAGVPALLFASAALAQPAGDTRPVMVILAHPDDELPMAPALSALARAEADVRLVYATSGDAGPGVSDFEPGAELAAAREDEARCSAKALGLGAPMMLGYGDGKLAEEARGTPDGDGLIARLASEIAAADPETIITWGPDGGYGHADHRLVSAFASQLVEGMPASERPALLYFGIRADRQAPVAELANWAKTDPALLSVRIGYDETDLAAAAAATQCHATQFDAASRAMLAPVFDQAIWQGAVDFRPAFASGGGSAD
ncbi:PIG-L family deacetylase [Citromicrobium bathyomarinum]